MQRDCYRCGLLIEGQLAFCSACGAPQIRVSRATEPEQPSATPDQPASGLNSGQSTVVPAFPADLARGMAGIDWKQFLRTAAPLAALIGMVTVPLALLGLFLLLPAGSIWGIFRYRQHRTGPLRGGQGARMGALMGLLSFGFFLAFFLAAVTSNWDKYCDWIRNLILERAAQMPDLPSQQMLQRFATPDGLIAFTAMLIAMFLVTFLIVGLTSGALAVALGNARNRP